LTVRNIVVNWFDIKAFQKRFCTDVMFEDMISVDTTHRAKAVVMESAQSIIKGFGQTPGLCTIQQLLGNMYAPLDGYQKD